ncbi:MAG: hypothetical protein Q7K39_03260 [Candidatus Magasanikbacteria bacterium]|nr:hypothetical protein [Candidatus Magasanikbacteria bacterium]
MIKNFLVSFIMILALMPGVALAAPNIGLGEDGLATGVAAGAGYAPATDTTLSESVGKVIRVILSMVGTIFLALTVYAGILWMTAAGAEDQIEKAQNIIKAASLGLIIVIAAYGITTIVVAAMTFASQPNTGATVGGKPSQSFWQQQGQYWQDWANNWKISTKSMFGIK